MKDNFNANYSNFWAWFAEHQKSLFEIVRSGVNIEADFLDKLDPKLKEVKDGIYYLTGMFDGSTAELILTVDGDITSIVFVEGLVSAAPRVREWKFTALKPGFRIENANITMDNYEFSRNTLSFYSNDDLRYPDDKLGAYLSWREKEFIEKYEGVVPITLTDKFSVIEGHQKNGKRIIASINTDILSWENKASHSWIATVMIPYSGKENGMPDKETYNSLQPFDDMIRQDLNIQDGYIYIGRRTTDNLREIYFACREFRKPSRVLHQLCTDNPARNIKFKIYKDKYWRSFNRFRPGI